MPFNKAVLKKELEIDEEGFASEVVVVSLKYQIHPKQKYEDVRSKLIQQIDKQFNEMFAAELGVMQERMEEGEQWVQSSLFANDAIREAVGFLKRNNAEFRTSSIDDEDDR